ncbi:small integral membrane protein 19 [Diceros bicornis minor]|uniref:small integral membrane protein 19 n=1 Tax=Diceros bicornis minor TaxID=77932 RepID=UPI0026EE85F4|nr:small integral membrane protein 19 [Diceros bicornis minor]
MPSITQKIVFPSLISIRGTLHIPPPTPRVTPRARRAGREEARNSRGTSIPATPRPLEHGRLHPRARPGAAGPPPPGARGAPARGRAAGGPRGLRAPGAGRRGRAPPRGGERSPAPLTRPGAAAGPSQRLSRSELKGGRGGKTWLLVPSGSRRPAGSDEGRGGPGPSLTGARACGPDAGERAQSRAAGRTPPPQRAAPFPGGYGVMGDDGSIDYSVHEAWNEATNVYLVVILVSFGLFMYAKRNKRKIMRIFSVPSTVETFSEPNFYDTVSKIRLRQQLEMYSISRKYECQQPQSPADSVQLSLE